MTKCMVAEPYPFTCPFCGEYDFDAIGLKDHLESGGCDEYERVPDVRPRFFS
jgi:hypothetical protein